MTANPQDPGAPDGRPEEPFPSLADGRRSSSKRGAAGRRIPKARTPQPEPVSTEAPPVLARRPTRRKRPQRTVKEPAVAVVEPVAAEPEPDRSLDDTQEIPIVAGERAPVEEPLVLVPGTLAVEGIPTVLTVPAEAPARPEAPPIRDAATEAAGAPPVVVASEPPAPEPAPAPPVAVRPAKRPKPPRAPRPPKVRKPRRLPAWVTRRRALRLNAVPVRVFATALVVALAIFAIGALRDDEPGERGTETAADLDPVLAPIPSEESASPSASPSPSPSSKSPSTDKPGKDDPPEDDPPKQDDPPSGGGGKAPKTGSFRIKSVSSGLCLDEADMGDSTVVQKSCSSSPLSAEGLESLGGGEYYLTTYHPEYHEGCISSAANGVGNGFIGDACTGDAAQIFSFDEVSDGVYRIRLADNGTCVAVSGGGDPVSANCGNAKNQRFIFV